MIIQTGASQHAEHPLKCLICKAEFTMHELSNYQRHVIACAKANEEYLHDLAERHKAKNLGGDEELEQWVDENREAIIEGRKSIYGEDREFWRKGLN